MKTLKPCFLLVFLSFSFLINCKKDITSPPLPCQENPSFDIDIKNIFLNNCTSCHNSSTNFAGVILEDYSSILLNIDHSIEEIQNGTMPPSGILDDTLISSINCWIQNGMPNN